MKKTIMILMMVTTGVFCFGQSSKSPSDSVYVGKSSTDSVYVGKSMTDSVYIGTSDSAKNSQGQKPLPNHSSYTKYEYTESSGARLIIRNSFPKSGGYYTDPNGKKYIYAVFWTQIINETANPLELKIDFSLDSFEFPPASGNYMKLLLPSEAMTVDKEPLYDYGLAVRSFLDNNRNKSFSLKRTIDPKGSTSFYVVTLSDRGVEGILRTGLRKKGQDFFYTISNYTPTPAPSLVNDKEIHCGKLIRKI